MDGHCFSCWIPVHGQCAPTQGFSKVLLRSNPNHPNGWRFTNENHPFTVRFPSLGLVQIPWRKNPEKTPNWSRKASQWIGFTKKKSAEHSVGKSSGDGPSLNINWHETSAKNPWPHGIHPKQRTPPFTSSPAEITWKFHRGMQKGPPWPGD